jgi:FtsZ-binding cell division protein ZapB
LLKIPLGFFQPNAKLIPLLQLEVQKLWPLNKNPTQETQNRQPKTMDYNHLATEKRYRKRKTSMGMPTRERGRNHPINM